MHAGGVLAHISAMATNAAERLIEKPEAETGGGGANPHIAILRAAESGIEKTDAIENVAADHDGGRKRAIAKAEIARGVFAIAIPIALGRRERNAIGIDARGGGGDESVIGSPFTEGPHDLGEECRFPEIIGIEKGDEGVTALSLIHI